MKWQDVCEHPDLKNLPFKIELTENGKILMTPVKVYHSVLQGEIAALLRFNRADGKILTECAISTCKGTKVADVAWASNETFNKIKDEIECPVAPELCVEVLFPSNTDDEIEDKMALYFSKGAQEVWLCNKAGVLKFYRRGEEINQSLLFPRFPSKIDYET